MSALLTNPDCFYPAAFTAFCVGSVIAVGIYALVQKIRDYRTDKQMRAGMRALFGNKR